MIIELKTQFEEIKTFEHSSNNEPVYQLLDVQLIKRIINTFRLFSPSPFEQQTIFAGEGGKALPVGSAGRAGVRPRSVHRSPRRQRPFVCRRKPVLSEDGSASGIHSATNRERGSLALRISSF
ncbi:hypothetical protein CDAR_524091 [Caerostris darwini]|uniref:Uncharacterized protein n=1 Tax=Caerostris darwini TaxID=1538125 RepID=A0AAV4TUU7_9ARAC|nr:hypothetical protein CDAR_524091 [Caerostris darwini]